MSSIDGSYRSSRAGNTARSHAPAASSYPSSDGTTSLRPSSPVSLDDVSTCCQRNRKRMKSAWLTGSISARSLFNV